MIGMMGAIMRTARTGTQKGREVVEAGCFAAVRGATTQTIGVQRSAFGMFRMIGAALTGFVALAEPEALSEPEARTP